MKRIREGNTYHLARSTEGFPENCFGVLSGRQACLLVGTEVRAYQVVGDRVLLLASRPEQAIWAWAWATDLEPEGRE